MKYLMNAYFFFLKLSEFYYKSLHIQNLACWWNKLALFIR